MQRSADRRAFRWAQAFTSRTSAMGYPVGRERRETPRVCKGPQHVEERGPEVRPGAFPAGGPPMGLNNRAPRVRLNGLFQSRLR